MECLLLNVAIVRVRERERETECVCLGADCLHSNTQYCDTIESFCFDSLAICVQCQATLDVPCAVVIIASSGVCATTAPLSSHCQTNRFSF